MNSIIRGYFSIYGGEGHADGIFRLSDFDLSFIIIDVCFRKGLDILIIGNGAFEPKLGQIGLLVVG